MMNPEPPLRDIRWLGDSRKVTHRFPKGARLILGKELTRIQMGMQPRDGDWLSNVGRGVQEIRIKYSKNAYRVIYVTMLAECIFVLHAFQKKSKIGIATPQEEIDLAHKRYRELVNLIRK